MDLMEIEFYSSALDQMVFLEITMGCNIYKGWSESGSKLTNIDFEIIEDNNHDAGMIAELTEDWRNGR